VYTCSAVEFQRLVDVCDDLDARVSVGKLCDDMADVCSVTSDYCSTVYEQDTDFGDIGVIEATSS
jgi:hypothetical protein